MCDLYCLPVVLVECAVTDTRMDISSRLRRPRYLVAFWCGVKFGLQRTQWSMDSVILWLTTSGRVGWVENPSFLSVWFGRCRHRRGLHRSPHIHVFRRPLGAFELKSGEWIPNESSAHVWNNHTKGIFRLQLQSFQSSHLHPLYGSLP